MADVIPIFHAGFATQDGAKLETLSNMIARRQLGIVYFCKAGHGGNVGITLGTPVATINRAIEIANSTLNGTGALPSATNRIIIYGLDDGVYEESVNLPDHVDLIAPGITIQGIGIVDAALTVGDDCNVYVFKVKSTQSITDEFLPNSAIVKIADGFGFVNVQEVYNGANGVGIASLSNNGALHAKVGIVFVASGSFGVAGGANNQFGHLHIYAGDIYFTGDNCFGVVAGSNSGTAMNIVGHVEHMLNFGGDWVGTVGFAAVSDVGVIGKIQMSADYVVAETMAIVQDGSYLRVQLSDGRVLGLPDAGVIAGTELVTLNVSGVTQQITLADLKTYMNAP